MQIKVLKNIAKQNKTKYRGPTNKTGITTWSLKFVGNKGG